MSIKEWAVEDRPREKWTKNGKSALSDSELLAILIGSGTQEKSAVELSRDILQSYQHNLGELGKANLVELCRFKGIGRAKALVIAAALELGRRRQTVLSVATDRITSSAEAYQYFRHQLEDLPHEEFWVMYLNRANRIIEIRRHTVGGIASTVVDKRLLLKEALELRAVSMILAHNHPSGNLKPSQIDLSITKDLKSSAALMDIKLLDHLIVTSNKYYSFADEGQLA